MNAHAKPPGDGEVLKPRTRCPAIPQPIPDTLSTVFPFRAEMVPDSVGALIMHQAKQLAAPPDYVAVATVVALGSVLGRRIAIRPTANTDWTEVPNLWGITIGEPGSRKSPAVNAALAPLKKLEDAAQEKFKAELKTYDADTELRKMKKDAANKRVKKAIDAGDEPNSADLLEEGEVTAPLDKRYRVNDCTYEAGALLCQGNPNGLLFHRDELVSWFKYLSQEEHSTARSFFLTAWEGNKGYTFDRIGRGTVRVPSVCISVIGTTQPGVIEEYLKAARVGGSKNDGWIQRFGLMVWPDKVLANPVDEATPTKLKEAAWKAFDRLDKLDPVDVGAVHEEGCIPYLRFTEEARELFVEWQIDLKQRTQTMTQAMASHLDKYDAIVPPLALINHLADGGTGPVSLDALGRAISFVHYLESHARRAYGAGQETGVVAAKAILAKFTAVGGIDTRRFTVREILRKHWSNLSDRADVLAGLDLLEDLDWITRAEVPTGYKGGRPKMEYFANPLGATLWKNFATTAENGGKKG